MDLRPPFRVLRLPQRNWRRRFGIGMLDSYIKVSVGNYMNCRPDLRVSVKLGFEFHKFSRADTSTGAYRTLPEGPATSARWSLDRDPPGWTAGLRETR